jgi:hypothetical protein
MKELFYAQLKGDYMDTKLNYKVCDNFDYSKLKGYGFYKTEPSGNPWWQNPLTFDRVGAIGFYKESLNINKETKEVYLATEDNFIATKYKDVISKLVEDNILINT